MYGRGPRACEDCSCDGVNSFRYPYEVRKRSEVDLRVPAEQVRRGVYAALIRNFHIDAVRVIAAEAERTFAARHRDISNDVVTGLQSEFSGFLRIAVVKSSDEFVSYYRIYRCEQRSSLEMKIRAAYAAGNKFRSSVAFRRFYDLEFFDRERSSGALKHRSFCGMCIDLAASRAVVFNYFSHFSHFSLSFLVRIEIHSIVQSKYCP